MLRHQFRRIAGRLRTGRVAGPPEPPPPEAEAWPGGAETVLPDAVAEPPPPPSWEMQRDGEAAVAVAEDPPDYKRYHQAIAARWNDFTGGSVLVLGCNRGEDCAYFIEHGAASVTGLDVMEQIGRNYADPRVTYVRASAEAMPIDAGRFDLVFAYATLEHVPDIRAAFAEMARVAAPGGIIYSAAAPLWCARSGPHWGAAFDHDPWPHLRLDTNGVVALGTQAAASGVSNPYYDAAQLRRLMDDPLMFNRRRPHEYLDACAMLEGVEILRNEIQMERQEGYDPGIVASLVTRGYTAFDLFGLTHLFIARRRAS